MAAWGCGGLPFGGDAAGEDGEQSVAEVTDRTDVRGFENVFAEDVPPEEKYPGEPGAVASFTEHRESFFDQPFPCNLRQSASGAPDLSDYPNPDKLPLLNDYISTAEAMLDGFSPNGAVYFRFDAPLSPLRFPVVYETISATSSILLVNVTQGSQFFGELIPVETWYWDKPAPVPRYFLEPYLLAVRPLGGFPMRAGEMYACVVTRKLKDANGLHLGQSPIVAAALSSDPGAKFYSAFSELRAWLETTQDVGPEDVAVATVFKVANPVAELAAAADYLVHKESIELSQPLEQKNTTKKFDYFVGKYLAPNFQAGDPPYFDDGGFVAGSSGVPEVQWYEEITFALTMPQGKPQPPQGWPIVLCAHGTGGSYKSCVQEIAEGLALEGIAMISIDQPLHGDRYTGPPIDVELYSFNFMNPDSGRCLFRQSALDSVSLAQFVKTANLSFGGTGIEFDPDRMGFFGHSQGGLTGALFLAVEGDTKAAVLSGSGGGLAYTIMLRKQIDSGMTFDIKAALEAMLDLEYEDEITVFHPVINLAQTLVDVSDPINYSPFYFHPRLRSTPANVIITEGVDDPYTPAITTDNLAIAGAIAPIMPIAHSHPGFDLRKLAAMKLPVSQNMACEDGKKSTAALVQFPGYGHFVAFENETCGKLWLNLLSSALVSGKAVIQK